MLLCLTHSYSKLPSSSWAYWRTAIIELGQISPLSDTLHLDFRDIAALRSVSFLLQLVESVECMGEVLQVTRLLERVVALLDAPVADLILLDAPICRRLLYEALVCGFPHHNRERIVLHNIFVRIVAIVEVLIARVLGQVFPGLPRELLLLLDHLGEQTQILQEVVLFLVL